VIVHSGVAVDNLTIAELRRILTGDREPGPAETASRSSFAR
jgi:hypothetical protein